VKEIEKIVRQRLSKVLDGRDDGAGLNLDADLGDGYGLGSLDLIMLMSSVCSEAGVPLTELGEDDIARLRTPMDIIDLLASRMPAQGRAT
jgi:acyl carrier protein